MKVPRQNSLLIQCVRQNNCPTPKSQCNADNAYSKARARGRVCALRIGKEQPGNKNMDGCWQHCLLSALWDTATARTLQWTQPRQYVWWSQRWRANTLQEQSMGWLGYETIFFPGFGWKGEWHNSLRIVFHCSSHSTASCRSMICYGTMSGAAQNPPQHFNFPPSWDFTNRALFCF